MSTSCFEVVDKTGGAPKTDGQRGGRGGRGGPNRGGRGAARGGEGRADFRSVRKDADGNPIEPANKREKRPFTGKPREDAHPMDRRSGTGRGRRAEFKKDGHGKGNIGDNEATQYKRKGETGEEEVKAEAPKQEEKKVEEPKVIIKEEVIGVSLDDFLSNKNRVARKEAREAEGVKGAKIEAAAEKQKQSTLLQNQ